MVLPFQRIFPFLYSFFPPFTCASTFLLSFLCLFHILSSLSFPSFHMWVQLPLLFPLLFLFLTLLSPSAFCSSLSNTFSLLFTCSLSFHLVSTFSLPFRRLFPLLSPPTSEWINNIYVVWTFLITVTNAWSYWPFTFLNKPLRTQTSD